jgi:hypothetical protein|tara:strand:+ start:149 stop:1477 length:1329 start_codon:yes stop_codon:yes gene_type:complete
MDLFTTFRSLLSRRKGSSNAELIIDTIRDIYEQRQETLQSRTENKLEQLANNRTIEKAANQKRFENSLDNRVLYQDYLIRPRETIDNYAIQLYNEDPNIEGTYDNKFKLVGNSKTLHESLWQEKLKDSERFITSLKDNPLANKPTFEEYDQVFLDSYNSKVNEVANDPRMASVAANLASRIFPKGFDDRVAKLRNEAQEAEARVKARKEQVQTVTTRAITEPVLSKEEAIDYVNKNFSSTVDIETIGKMNDIIDAGDDRRGYTVDEIVGIGLFSNTLQSEFIQKARDDVGLEKGKFIIMREQLGKSTSGDEFEASLNEHLKTKFFNIDDDIPKEIKRVEDTVKYLEELKKDPIKNATLIEAIEKQLRIANSGNGLKEKIMFNTANTITAKLIDPDFQLILNRYLADNKDKTENDYYNEILDQAFSTVVPLLNTIFEAELGRN